MNCGADDLWNNLEQCQIIDIGLEVSAIKDITINLVNPLSTQDIRMIFRNPLHFSFSRTSGDDGAFQIYEVHRFKPNDPLFLSGIDYAFHSGETNSAEVFGISRDELMQIYIEGELTLNILCSNVELVIL